MINKNKIICICIVMIIIFTGCDNKSEKVTGTDRIDLSQGGVKEVLNEGMEKENISEEKPGKNDVEDNETYEIRNKNLQTQNDTEPVIEKEPFDENKIDIDLTQMSSTMIYTEVYNMMVAPDEYKGKSVKMEGLFSSYFDENKKKYYYACIVQDATACCAQGIEFEPLKACVYPEDFPKEGGMVTVTGIFDSYEEEGYKYCTLREADYKY
ncbi:MAG: hypothetical protein K6E98_07070 [Lachnospiraceae bacterium]|nr:hypothetical protein [Lachnospiraceae bacterium]